LKDKLTDKETEKDLNTIWSNDPGSKPCSEALSETDIRYKKLVENSLTGVYIDQDGKIVYANGQFVEIYGYARDEIIGMESRILVHPDDREMTDETRSGGRTGRG
jgi:PAS domain S-box-containing protein